MAPGVLASFLHLLSLTLVCLQVDPALLRDLDLDLLVDLGALDPAAAALLFLLAQLDFAFFSGRFCRVAKWDKQNLPKRIFRCPL